MADVPAQLAESLRARYVLERELGCGGMATVYLAHDVKHDRSVALKVLHPELASVLGPERFQREIRLAARLQHPHILTVLDSGEAAGATRDSSGWSRGGEGRAGREARARQCGVRTRGHASGSHFRPPTGPFPRWRRHSPRCP